jgi:hypothetical protein
LWSKQQFRRSGSPKTSAEGFFERLLNAGIKKVVDVRLHNTSQLAGFAKADDLAYLLRKIGAFNTCTIHCSHRRTRCSKRTERKMATGARTKSDFCR